MMTRALAAWILVAPVAAGTARADLTGPAALAARIDRLVAARCEQQGIRLAPPAQDAEFLRRVYLDLIGRIPTVAEARVFLLDAAPDKRAQLVRRLLDAPDHAPHLATFWQRSWMPQLDGPQFANLVDASHQWLTLRLREKVPYDRIVHELLTVDLRKSSSGTGADGVPTSRAFLAVGEYKPELLAANTARAFLGVNLDCAQCHDHPFARWTREQFWQTAAFFKRPKRGEDIVPVRFELTIPDTQTAVAPRLLTDQEVRWPERLDSDSGRHVLADWITSADNSYLARNAANRLWACFFGTGLVEPLDDLSEENPASHPELLDALAAALAASKFDMRYLIEAITLSETYQRTSAAASLDEVPTDQRLLARMPVRGLTGEQLYDSLYVAAGLPAPRDELRTPTAVRHRRRFARAFDSPRPAEAERSIVQALAMMNGPLTSSLLGDEGSSTVSAVAGAPFLDTRGKVDALVLATLSRPPYENEIAALVDYVEQQAPRRGMRQALGDVFWALLNSSEFNTNH